MKKPKAFQMYLDYADQFSILTDEQAGKLIKEILRYANTGDKPEFSDDQTLSVMFSLVSGRMERDFEKYDDICKKRGEARKKANESNDIKSNQLISNDIKSHQNNQLISNDNKSDQMISKKSIDIKSGQSNTNTKSNTKSKSKDISDDISKREVEREIDEVVTAFNEICGDVLPSPAVRTDIRDYAIRRAMKKGVDLKRAFFKAKESAFLTGKNEKGWRATLDWILEGDNAVKILEGAFDNTRGSPKKNSFNFANDSFDIRNHKPMFDG